MLRKWLGLLLKTPSSTKPISSVLLSSFYRGFWDREREVEGGRGRQARRLHPRRGSAHRRSSWAGRVCVSMAPGPGTPLPSSKEGRGWAGLLAAPCLNPCSLILLLYGRGESASPLPHTSPALLQSGHVISTSSQDSHNTYLLHAYHVPCTCRVTVLPG